MSEGIKSKPFKTGGSVAVRIPRQFNLELDDEVIISSPKEGVIVLEIKENLWESKLKATVSEAVESGAWDDAHLPEDAPPEPVERWE
jgi:virulence-associated protein VagC